MKIIELLNRLAGTLPSSPNGMFWNDDVLYALEALPKNDVFSGEAYVEFIEEFLPKVEMDVEDKACDYAFELWKIGNVSEVAKHYPEELSIFNQLGENNYFYEDDIDKNTITLRLLIDEYKKGKGL